MLAEVGAWPEREAQAVQDYDATLCSYLGVGREPPPSTSKVSILLPPGGESCVIVLPSPAEGQGQAS